jgi:lysophospholipase L1-like esterase
MIRLFHDGTANGSHSIIQGLQPSGGYADQAAKAWYREWQVGNSTSVDMVANLATEPGSLSGSTFWIEVEFAYRGVAAKTVLGVGDSILEANATQLPGNVYGAYGFRGCSLASTPEAPVQWVNAGMSSQSSAVYFAQGRAALAQFTPTHVLYSAYSPNDANQPAQFETDAMRQRVLQMLELCRAQKARMLLVTAVPNETHTLATDNARKDFNAWVRGLCATGAAQLVDYAAAVGNGASPELYSAGMKFDAFHPSDAAMDLGAELVRSAILAA